jgi:hypothetical protein
MKQSFCFLLLLLTACESRVIDRDMRQIRAKDEIRSKLPPRAREFDITDFREDTLKGWSDTAFKRPLVYILQYQYKDSTGAFQRRMGHVVFTPDGRSVISTEVDSISNP